MKPVDHPLAQGIAGAIRFPVFLLAWSFGLVLVSGQMLPAGASLPERQLTLQLELAPVPDLHDVDAWTAPLDRELAATEVISGRWQPRSVPDGQVTAVAIPAPALAPTIELRPADEPAPSPGNVDASADAPAQPENAPAGSLVPSAEFVAAAGSSGAPADASDGSVPQVRKLKRVVPASQTDDVKREARRLIGDDRFEQAYRVLRTSVRMARLDTEYLGLFAAVAMRTARPQEAELVYERLVALEPEQERWWTGLALAREQQGLAAAPLYDQALALATRGSPIEQLISARIGASG